MKFFVILALAFACQVQALPQYGQQNGRQTNCKVITTVEYEETYVPDCKTVYEKVCDTLYRNKCNDYQDEVCKTVQKRHCDQKRKQECRTEYRSVSEPYTEQKCDKVEKCEKTWKEDGYGNKVWEEDRSNCLYEDKCYDVQLQRQVKQPYEECDWKNYEDCYNKPEKQCDYVTKQRCNKEPYEECNDVPREDCKQIHKQIPKEVKKRVCGNGNGNGNGNNNGGNNNSNFDDVHGNDGSYSAADVGNAFIGERKNVKTKDVVDIRSGNADNHGDDDDDDKVVFG